MKSTHPHAVQAHGWTVFAHPLFLAQLESLRLQVAALKLKEPEHYRKKNASKRLAAVMKLVLTDIPLNPASPAFRQGGTLGEHHKHWFRAKFFQQYRLFFRYHEASKVIVLGWVNDEATKRAYESADDAYRVFRAMLARGQPPSDWASLLAEAKAQGGAWQALLGGALAETNSGGPSP